MTFYKFATHLTGKQLVNKETYKPYFKWEAFYMIGNMLELVESNQHPEYKILDKPGWKDGKVVDLKLAFPQDEDMQKYYELNHTPID